MVEKFLDVKAVLRVAVRRVLEIRVPCQVVLVRQERPHAPELEDALAAVQHRQFVHARQFYATLSSEKFNFARKKSRDSLKSLLFLSEVFSYLVALFYLLLFYI